MLNAERGLVVTRRGNEVTVLTPEGEWRTVRLAGLLPEVGEEVMLPPVKRRPPWQVVTAAAAVIMLLFLALPMARRVVAPPPGTPAYYINIDINPSVELAVDEREKVLSARGLNSAGEKLLAAVALKDEKAATAIQILTREAVRQGYYLPDRPGAMMVTVVPADGDGEQMLASGEELGLKLTREASSVLEQARVPALVEAAAVQPEIRQHAVASGLSAGRYSILLEALDAGLPVTAADLKKEGLARTLEKFDSNWGQLMGKLQKDKDLLQKEQRLGVALQKALGQLPEPGGNDGGNDDGNGGGNGKGNGDGKDNGNGDGNGGANGERGQAGQKQNIVGNGDQAGPGRGEAATMDKGKNNGQPDNKPESPGRGKGSSDRGKGPLPGRVNPSDRSGLDMAREIRAMLRARVPSLADPAPALIEKMPKGEGNFVQ